MKPSDRDQLGITKINIDTEIQAFARCRKSSRRTRMKLTPAGFLDRPGSACKRWSKEKCVSLAAVAGLRPQERGADNDEYW